MNNIALLTSLLFIVIVTAGLWRAFEKAGYPGWKAAIPLYNMGSICEIAGKPASWLLLMLIPGVSIVIWVLIMISFAKKFGQSTALGWACAFFIGLPILGFGHARYLGTSSN